MTIIAVLQSQYFCPLLFHLFLGYARLSPRTAAGKILAVVYAIIGVPLMLLLLSALGSLLASGARKGYSKLCCKPALPKTYHHHTVGYHKAPSSPTIKRNCRSSHEGRSQFFLRKLVDIKRITKKGYILYGSTERQF